MKLIRWIKNINPFAVVEGVLTAASVALVTATVGNQLGAHLGVSGDAGLALGWAIALVFDVLWVSALKMSVTAIRQRSLIGMIVMLTVSLASVGASVAALFILGHAAAYAFTPVAVLVFMGLRLFSEHTLADAATARIIATASADARNAAALARSEAHTAASAAKTATILDTAAHMAAIRQDITRIELLTDGDTKLSAARAKAMAKLEAAERKHGAAAAKFQELRSLPARDVTETPAEPPVSASDDFKAPLAWSGVDEDTYLEASGFSELDVMLDDLDDVTAMNEAVRLEDMAKVAGVSTPEPGTALTDAQLVVVLRWLRYSQNPPLAKRAAVARFRSEGFQAGEARVRAAWDAVEAAETQA